MNVVFMGTPDFAVHALGAIIEKGHNVTLVVTQPDKECGRGKEVKFPPVKECALANGIEVYQPVKIKDPEAVLRLKEVDADIYVVAAFGQILSKEILDIPKYGCVNIHASLLPKYRGAAPIQWSILDGMDKTGVTIQQMNEGLDTGDILLQKEIKIEDTDTGESLFNKLAILGSEAIVDALEKIEDGTIVATPQDDSESTYAGKLDKAMGRLDFSWDVEVLERYVRGLNSWPSAYTYIGGKTLKIWEAHIATECGANGAIPGTIVKIDKEHIYVACGNGVLSLDCVQLEGKKRMNTAAFLLGNKLEEGTVVG